MRHFTWAVAWFIVGLTVTLGTASILQQVVMTRQATAAPTVEPTQGPAPTAKPPAEGRELVVAARRFNREH
jgi:hypothetical protein